MSLDLLQELKRTYDPKVLICRYIFGHTSSQQAYELPACGTIESLELEDDILYGYSIFNSEGKKLIEEGKAVYVSIAFTCAVVDEKENIDYLPKYVDPMKAIPLGDGTWGIGYQVDEKGDLIGGTGVYLNHVALLGGSAPAIPGQPTLQEQIKK